MNHYKKIVSAVLVIIMLFGTSAVSFAESERAGKIRSKGNIVYDGGENRRVELYSDDLRNLANEIDELENNYDRNLVNGLSEIGTYFNTEGSITHKENNKAYDMDNATQLSFGNLLSGISESQSIEDAGLPFVDESGNQQYVLRAGGLTTDAGESAKAVTIQAADAGNLTAGVQAWVNGVLITGNGADNHTYYDVGYSDGYDRGFSDGYAQSLSNATIKYTYHTHVDGNGSRVGSGTTRTSIAGGCFGQQEMSAPVVEKVKCVHINYYTETHIQDGELLGYTYYFHGRGDQSDCPGHPMSKNGESFSGDGAEDGTHYFDRQISAGGPTGYYLRNCGKTESTIETATIVFK